MASTDDGQENAQSEEDGEEQTGAPDGGWAWMICLSCFVVQAIMGGLVYSFGLLYVELLDHFQRPKGETAWVLSIFQGVSFLGGPLYSAIVSRVGCRLASSMGSCLLATGFMISQWAPSLYFLYFSIGVLGGFGFGLVYLVSIMGVSQYFDKHRSLATGIGVSGVGIGTLAFGPLLKMFMEEYTWKGAVLLEGAISLNCLACSLLYRPLEDVKRSCHRQRNKKRKKAECSATCKLGVKAQNDVHVTDKSTFMSDEEIPMCLNQSETVIQCNGVDLSANSICSNLNELESDPFISRNSLENNHKAQEDGTATDIVPNGTSHEHNVADKTNADAGDVVYEIDGLIGMGHQPTSKSKIYRELMRNVPFIFMLISTFLLWLVFVVPYLYIVDTANMFHIEASKSAWIIAAMGISNTVGRTLYGYVGSLRCVNRHYFYIGSLVTGGVTTMVIPFSKMFESILCLGALYGLISGGTLALSVVLLVDVVDSAHSTEGLGLFCAACGLGYFVGPPFAGWLFDITGTYLTTYLFSGITFMSAGLIICCVPCFKGKLS